MRHITYDMEQKYRTVVLYFYLFRVIYFLFYDLPLDKFIPPV